MTRPGPFNKFAFLAPSRETPAEEIETSELRRPGHLPGLAIAVDATV